MITSLGWQVISGIAIGYVIAKTLWAIGAGFVEGVREMSRRKKIQPPDDALTPTNEFQPMYELVGGIVDGFTCALDVDMPPQAFLVVQDEECVWVAASWCDADVKMFTREHGKPSYVYCWGMDQPKNELMTYTPLRSTSVFLATSGGCES